jgi:hypothetical protein
MKRDLSGRDYVYVWVDASIPGFVSVPTIGCVAW